MGSMNDQIICPHCHKSIPLTQALSHELKAKLNSEKLKELDEEKKRLNEEAKKWRLEQIKKIEDKIKETNQLEIKDKINELNEIKKQNQTLQQQFLTLNQLIRQLKTEKEQGRLDFEKKLTEEQEKIRIHEQKRLDQEYRLKIMEKDKKLDDAMKMVEDYKRKLEQGSQQLQGEVLELELENILRREFPYDDIKPVPKGINGPDLIQIVKNNHGKICGTIVWETKRTQSWSDSWIEKLRDDQRKLKAEMAVIITKNLPKGINSFTQINSIWIGSFESYLGLGLILRSHLIELNTLKSSTVNKEEKKEILWNYLTSTEFRQRVEAVYDSYSTLSQDLKKERDYFTKKWAKQEKNIQKVADNILGIHGDLQGIVGKSLPEIQGLDMLSDGVKSEI